MKINQNVTYFKTEVVAPVVVSNKSNAVAGASAAQPPTAASAARLPSTTGDFDVGRVAEIRENIRAGSYKIDSSKIADGLISSIRDLVGKSP